MPVPHFDLLKTDSATAARRGRLRTRHGATGLVPFLIQRYGRLAALASLLHAILKFLSPEMISAKGRLKARAFFAGTRTALRQSDLSASAVSA